MVQLWVNLPAKDKMTPARYQAITDAQIPSVALPDERRQGARDRRRVRGRPGPGRAPSRP
jgi:redox-sensitive bicupin YhaK (pirin superfamily)